MTKRLVAFFAALLSSFAVFVVVALWGGSFGLDGTTPRALHPGTTVPINVRISNPHFYPIVVSDLRVRIASITPAHKGVTCRISNYTLTQASNFSVRLDPFSSASMKSISSSSSDWPTLHLTGNLDKIDSGCQGATVNLAYSASGSWWTK